MELNPLQVFQDKEVSCSAVEDYFILTGFNSLKTYGKGRLKDNYCIILRSGSK